MSIESFEDPKWLDFIKKCEKQVEEDNKEFGINSVFLPNPKICHNPKYCLIAMEPLEHSVEDVKNLPLKINEGYRNFIEGYEELIIHYCAYHYLGGEGWNYYITDLMKGSMTGDDAERSRKELWPIWQGLLREEMTLLGNPKPIAIGNCVYNFMNNKRKSILNANHYIQHYSNQKGSSDAREKEYNYISNQSKEFNTYCEDINEEKLEEFVFDKLMKKLEYKRIDAVKQALNERWKLYALYRHNFESLTKNGKVLHLP